MEPFNVPGLGGAVGQCRRVGCVDSWTYRLPQTLIEHSALSPASTGIALLKLSARIVLLRLNGRRATFCEFTTRQAPLALDNGHDVRRCYL